MAMMPGTVFFLLFDDEDQTGLFETAGAGGGTPAADDWIVRVRRRRR